MSSREYNIKQLLYGSWWVPDYTSPNAHRESGFNASVSWLDYLHGGDDPSYRQKIARHENATNDYDAAERHVDIHPGSASYVYKEGTDDEWEYSVYGNLIQGHTQAHFLSVDPDLVALVKAATDAKFIAKYNSKRSAFESGVFTGEIRETLRALRHPLKSFRDVTREYLERTRRLKRSWGGSGSSVRSRAVDDNSWDDAAKRRLLGAIGDSWMEYRFGIRPILKDIASLESALNRPLYNYEVFGTKSEVKTASTHTEADVSFGGTAWVKTTESSKWTYSCVEVGEIAHRNGATARQLQDFGAMPENWGPTLWELLPYSWLMERFTNLGDIVNAACVNFADLSWFSRTTRTVSTNERIGRFVVGVTASNYSSRGSIPTRQVWYRKDVARTGNRPSVPSFQWHLPHGLDQYLDVGFLAQQRVLDRQPPKRKTRNVYRS